MGSFTESTVEQAASRWRALAGRSGTGADIAPDCPGAATTARWYWSSGDALGQLNRGLPAVALDDAFRKLTRPEGAELSMRNRSASLRGRGVEYRTPDGAIRGAQAQVLDFENTDANDWLAVNQFTVAENKHSRPDIVLFVNGLPLAVVELKNAADENATIWTAFQQLQTCKGEVPSLFATNAASHLRWCGGASERLPQDANGSSPGAPSRASAWLIRITTGAAGGDRASSLPGRFLDLRDFIVFEDEGGGQAEEDGGLPPVPRGAGGGERDAAGCRAAPRGRPGGRGQEATRPAGSPAASWVTGASGWWSGGSA